MEQNIALLYFQEIAVVCTIFLILLMYVFYVRYPTDREIPEDEGSQWTFLREHA